MTNITMTLRRLPTWMPSLSPGAPFVVEASVVRRVPHLVVRIPGRGLYLFNGTTLVRQGEGDHVRYLVDEMEGDLEFQSEQETVPPPTAGATLKSPSEDSPESPYESKILALLSKKPCGPKEVATILEIEPEVASHELHTMLSQGKVSRAGQGRGTKYHAVTDPQGSEEETR